MDKLKMHTPSLADANFAAIAALFPNAVTETIVGYEPVLDKDGKQVVGFDGIPKERAVVERVIDKDVLMQEISAQVVEGREERYQFTWPDKKKSVLLANAPIAAALRPCREESVDFDTTENLYIEGDNLDVLKLLRETYLSRVKMIYIDPPYNTGSDSVYNDDFSQEAEEFLRTDGYYDADGNRMRQNRDSNGRFHTDWLNMLYPRLRIARDLLMDEGLIAISIDGNELNSLLKICNEIFSEENFVNVVTVKSATTASFRSINVCPVNVTEFVILYRKSAKLTLSTVYTPVDYTEDYSHIIENFNSACDTWRIRSLDEIVYEEAGCKTRQEYRKLKGSQWKKIRYDQKRIIAFNERHRVASLNTLQKPSATVQAVIDQSQKSKGIVYKIDRDNNTPIYVYNGRTLAFFGTKFKDFKGNPQPAEVLTNFWGDISYLSLGKEGDVPFSNGKKPISLIQRLMEIFTFNNDIVMDFFSGSGTTAHSTIALNGLIHDVTRHFIMVQLPENLDKNLERATDPTSQKQIKKTLAFLDSISKPHILTEIGKERIRRAGAKIKADSPLTTADLDVGFRVLKLDSSNMKDVYYTPDEFLTEAQRQQSIFGFMDNIKEDRSPEDLLFQVMLDLGIPLSAKIKQDGDVFYVDDNYLVACFKQVDTAMITEIAKKKPFYAVFRDSSFLSDSAMINFEQVFNTYSPNTTRRVL